MPQLPPIGSPMPDEGLPPIGSPMPDDLAPPPSAEQLVKTGGARLWRAATDPIIGPLSPLDILGMGSASTLAIGGAAKLFGGLRRAKPFLPTPTGTAFTPGVPLAPAAWPRPMAGAAPRVPPVTIPAKTGRRLVLEAEEFAAQDINQAARLAAAKPEAVVKGTEYAAFGKKGAPLGRIAPPVPPAPTRLPPGTTGTAFTPGGPAGPPPAIWSGPPPTPPPVPLSKAAQAFDTAQGIRAESALSGLAITKNVLTGVGAAPQLAVEMKSLKPITEILRPIKMGKSFVQGFKTPIDIGATGVRRVRGPFGRTISGVDKAFIDAFERAGVPTTRINEMLLREPTSKFLTPGVEELLQHPVGKGLNLFVRNPVNQYFGGTQELIQGFKRSTPLAQRLLTAGATGTGAAADVGIENQQRRNLAFPLLFALGGRRGLAMALGGAASAGIRKGKAAGARVMAGQAPFPEYGMSPINWVLPYPPAAVPAYKRIKEAVRGRALPK